MEKIIDKHYKNLLEEMIDTYGDSFTEVLIEVEVAQQGKTIRRSWKDRDKMLEEWHDDE